MSITYVTLKIIFTTCIIKDIISLNAGILNISSCPLFSFSARGLLGMGEGECKRKRKRLCWNGDMCQAGRQTDNREEEQETKEAREARVAAVLKL